MRIIAINEDRIKEITRHYEGAERNFRKFYILHTYVHEQVHAISNTRFPSAEDQAWTVGYHRIPRQSLFMNDAEEYGMLNEAVTEHLANRLWKEYITAMWRFFGEDSRQFSERLERFYRGNTMMQTAYAAIGAIADAAGVSESDVWDGLVHGMISGANLDDPEIIERVDEVTYLGFMNEWKYAHDDNDLEKILERLRTKGATASPTLAERARSIFSKVSAKER